MKLVELLNKIEVGDKITVMWLRKDNKEFCYKGTHDHNKEELETLKYYYNCDVAWYNVDFESDIKYVIKLKNK